MAKRILIVDDERTVLRALENTLKDEPYQITYMTSGLEALTYIEENQVDLIISDTTMREIEGDIFLAEIKKRRPNIPRVALCHISESRRINKLIEKGLAKQYLFKPWDDYELRLHIKNIIEMDVYLMNEENLGKINSLDELPSLPSLYHELSAMIERDADMDEVAALIARDQAIASKILKLANSAFYGRKTGDITQAMMTLGLNNVRNIVLTNSFFKESSESLDGLWQHTIETNRLCVAIYEQCLKKRMPSLYGSAGLLHDIGQVILFIFYADQYSDLIDEARSTDYTLINLELTHFHTTHQDIGAYLLNYWGLPYAYVEAAIFHHRPMDERVVNQELVAVVHLADYYVSKWLSPSGTHNLLDQGVFDRLNITKDQLELVVHSLKKEAL